MPIQMGGPSLPKPKPVKPVTVKKPKVIDPFGVPHVGPQPLPPLAAAKPIGLTSPLGVTIPQANTIVKPNAGGGGGGGNVGGGGLGNYTGEITSDPMYGIGQKNYEDALTLGEASTLRSPIAQLLSTYGYDPRAYLAAHPESGLSQASIDLANKYLDPAALAAAQKDPATVANQIAKGFDQSLAAVPGSLAETGLERSGSSAIMGNKLTYDRALQDRQAMDQFLGGVGTANQNWLDYRNQAADTWRQAQEAIATRLSNDAGYHAMLDAQGNEVENPEESWDAANGGAPAGGTPATGMTGMGGLGVFPGYVNQAAQAAKTPTQKAIAKVKAKATPSPWQTAMGKLSPGPG